jgi:hypothetical protein
VLGGEEALALVETVEADVDPVVVEAVEEFVGDDGKLLADGQVPEKREQALLAEAQQLVGELRAICTLEQAVEALIDRSSSSCRVHGID